MGGALLRGWVAAEELRGRISLLAYDCCAERCALEGVNQAPSASVLAAEADVLVLALKPGQIPAALRELASFLKPDGLIISIAAGLGLKRIKESSGGANPAALVLPNTPARVGRGVFGICLDDPALTEEQRRLTLDLFSALGQGTVLPESSLNAFSALMGCGPAYIYYFLDALTEAGVCLGFSREEAARLALALSSGSTALAEQSGQPLPLLREQVCSPAGTTIAAMNKLDREAVRGHIVDAVLAAFEKGKELSTNLSSRAADSKRTDMI